MLKSAWEMGEVSRVGTIPLKRQIVFFLFQKDLGYFA